MTGHLQVMCQANKKGLVNCIEDSDEESEESQIYHVILCASGGKRGDEVLVNIEGTPIPMLLDTGAAVSSMPESVFKENCDQMQPFNSFPQDVYRRTIKIERKGRCQSRM